MPKKQKTSKARSKRILSSEETSLWQKVTKDVEPITQGDPSSHAHLTACEDQNAPHTLVSKPPRKQYSKPLLTLNDVKASLSPLQHSLVGAGDPRQAKRVSRGRRNIDATLDLHGLTQEQAFQRLQLFLNQAKIHQNKCVLVITGKGPPEARNLPLHEAPRGVLRRRFLDWVDGPLSHHIASVSQAHQRHGGAGAFYVFLKK